MKPSCVTSRLFCLVGALACIGAVNLVYADRTAVARLDTDTNADHLLERAQAYLSAEQYREATIVMQVVLDKFPHAVTTTDEQRYAPARLKVQRMMIDAGPEALAAYRLNADGPAGAMFQKAMEGRIDVYALRQIVHRYFLSSHGDDAAYALGCLLLDRHDFLAARRLFRMIVTVHPDTSIPEVELHFRLGLACARLGDVTGGRAALNTLNRAPAADQRRIEILQTELEGRKALSCVEHTNTIELPTSDDGSTWTEIWNHKPGAPIPITRTQRIRAALKGEAAAVLPIGRAVGHDGRIYFKTGTKVICLDAMDGKTLWQQRSPAQPTNVQYAENVGFLSQLSVIDSVLYHIETDGVVHLRNRGRDELRVTASLVAMDAGTGQLRWRLARIEHTSGQRQISRAHFLAAPVKSGSLIVAPVLLNNELWLVAINPATGRTVWASFCSSIQPGTAITQPAAVLVEGESVYLCIGRGMVFSFDGVDGHMRWATRYPTGAVSRYSCDNALIIRWGQLFLLASDAPGKLTSFDLSNGKRIGTIDAHGMRDILGVHDDALILWGEVGIKAITSTAQRMKIQWKAKANISHRPALIHNHIVIARKHGFKTIDARTGRHSVQWQVKPSGPGALVQYQDRLIGIGHDSVRAWCSSSQYEIELDQRVAAGDSSALFKRAKLYQCRGDINAAVTDLLTLDTPRTRRTMIDLLLSHKRYDRAKQVANTEELRAIVAFAKAEQLNSSDKPEAERLYRQLLQSPTDLMLLAATVDGRWMVPARAIAQSRLDQLAGKSIVGNNSSEAESFSSNVAFGTPPWRMAWHAKTPGVRLLTIGQPAARRASYWQEHLLLFSPGWGQLVCRQVDDFGVAWALPIDDTFASAIEHTEYGNRLRAAACGDTLVVRTDQHLIGIDQQNGRIRWQHETLAIEQDMRYFPGDVGLNIGCDADARLVLQLVRDTPAQVDRVEAIDPATGKLKWARTYSQRVLLGVRLARRHALILVGHPAALQVCHRETGAVISEYEVVWRSPVLWLNDALCLPTKEGLQLIEILTGQPRWMHSSKQECTPILKTSNEIAVVINNVEVKLLDQETGNEQWRFNSGGAEGNEYQLGVMAQGNFLLQQGNRRHLQQSLLVLDHQTGQPITQTPAAKPVLPMPVDTQVQCGRYVPLVEINSERRNRTRLRWFDLTASRWLDGNPTPAPDGREWFIHMRHPPIVQGEFLIVASDEGVMAFSSAARKKDEGTGGGSIE